MNFSESPKEETQVNPTNDFPKDGNLKFTWRWRDLLVIFIGIFLLVIIGVIIFVAVTFARGENLDNFLQPTISQTLLLTALEAAALILGVYLFGLRLNKRTWKDVGVRSTTWPWVIISTIITIIIIPIASLITIAILFASGQPLENPQIDFLLPEGLSAINAFYMLILAGILAPLGEELLFRGVLYTFIRERWGIWIGVVASALIFGLIHGNLAVGITAFILGIVTALVFEYSKSLWTAVIVHAINNSLKIAVLYLLILLGLEL